MTLTLIAGKCLQHKLLRNWSRGAQRHTDILQGECFAIRLWMGVISGLVEFIALIPFVVQVLFCWEFLVWKWATEGRFEYAGAAINCHGDASASRAKHNPFEGLEALCKFIINFFFLNEQEEERKTQSWSCCKCRRTLTEGWWPRKSPWTERTWFVYSTTLKLTKVSESSKDIMHKS